MAGSCVCIGSGIVLDRRNTSYMCYMHLCASPTLVSKKCDPLVILWVSCPTRLCHCAPDTSAACAQLVVNSMQGVVSRVFPSRSISTLPSVFDMVLPAHRSYSTFIRSLVSPVFFSTAEDGSTQRGLAGVPNDRPMLLVGNHQTFALDLGIFVEQIVRERGFLPRGLAHPAIFSVRDAAHGEGVGLLPWRALPASP